MWDLIILISDYCLSFFPRYVLDEVLDLTESVSEGFPNYSFYLLWKDNVKVWI